MHTVGTWMTCRGARMAAVTTAAWVAVEEAMITFILKLSL